MVEQEVRIDRVIRVTIWNQQTVSVLVHDARLYIIRTGVLAAAATGSVLSEGAMLLPSLLFGGGGEAGGGQKGLLERLAEKLADEVVDEAKNTVIAATGNRFERALTGVADKDARKREALINPSTAGKLATGWMSANLPLGDITAATVSKTSTSRVDGIVPQLKLTARERTITLRFPQTPPATVEAFAAYLRQGPRIS